MKAEAYIIATMMLGLCATPSLAAETPPRPEGEVALLLGGGPLGVGIEADLAYPNSPFRLGGLMWGSRAGHFAETAWAGYNFALIPGHEVTFLAGGTHYPQSVSSSGRPPELAQNGLFAAVRFTWSTERFWARVTPQVYAPLGLSFYPAIAMSGLPWLEVGWVVTPRWTVSARLGETLLKIGYRL